MISNSIMIDYKNNENNDLVDSGIKSPNEIMDLSNTELTIDDEKKLMSMDYGYPDPSNANIQKKIFDKIDFQSHRIQPRQEVKNYEESEEYRNSIC